MANLPDRLEEILVDETYERQNIGEVKDAINRLGLAVSETFLEFYGKYIEPFWEDSVPLDIVEDTNTIESFTVISRKEHEFPKQYIVLSEMSANAVLVLDTITDKVYKVEVEMSC